LSPGPIVVDRKQIFLPAFFNLLEFGRSGDALDQRFVA
jgi:hypothetical protein